LNDGQRTSLAAFDVLSFWLGASPDQTVAIFREESGMTAGMKAPVALNVSEISTEATFGN
jgi:hypothetical protein